MYSSTVTYTLNHLSSSKQTELDKKETENFRTWILANDDARRSFHPTQNGRQSGRKGIGNMWQPQSEPSKALSDWTVQEENVEQRSPLTWFLPQCQQPSPITYWILPSITFDFHLFGAEHWVVSSFKSFKAHEMGLHLVGNQQLFAPHHGYPTTTQIPHLLHLSKNSSCLWMQMN